MLVLIGATPEGRKELIGFQAGVRESAQSWRELLIDMKHRGLSVADSDEAGRVFRFQAGQHSNLKPATVPI